MIKKMWFSILMVIILGIVLLYNQPVTNYFAKILDNQNKVVILDNNPYKRNYSFSYIEHVEDFVPYSYNSLLNIIYSILNNGWDNFTFYCPIEYTNCIADIKKITNDNKILTHLNNFIHPYNSFNNIITSVDSSGEIIIEVKKLYTETQIAELNFKVTEIANKVVDNEDDLEIQLKAIHDYIINNTKYDINKTNNESDYLSNIAYGSLLQGYAICSGYADAMALFLNHYNIPNYKISSETHVWNAVFINEKWYHLDLTWDDPISDEGVEKLIHKFFLINTDNLKRYATTDHNFNNTIYQEFRYN